MDRAEICLDKLWLAFVIRFMIKISASLSRDENLKREILKGRITSLTTFRIININSRGDFLGEAQAFNPCFFPEWGQRDFKIFEITKRTVHDQSNFTLRLVLSSGICTVS